MEPTMNRQDGLQASFITCRNQDIQNLHQEKRFGQAHRTQSAHNRQSPYFRISCQFFLPHALPIFTTLMVSRYHQRGNRLPCAW